MKESKKKGIKIRKSVEINPIYLIIPLIAPLVTPIILGLIVIITGIVVIGAVIAGVGSGASVGSAIGGVLGGVVAFGIGTAISQAVYYALPPLFFILGMLTYFSVSILEETLGHSYYAKVFDYEISIRLFSFLSLLSIGVVSYIVLEAISNLGIFEDARQKSNDGMSDAIRSLDRKVGFQIDIIRNYIDSFKFIALIAVFLSFLWFLFIYVGQNFIISKSIRYCIDIILTAFVMDFVFTLISFLAIIGFDLNFRNFVEFFNYFDNTLRYIAMLPVRTIFVIFFDLAPLFDAIQELISIINDLVFSLIEIGLRVVLFEKSMVQRFLFNLIDFARFLKVDFIFFVAASVIYYRRLQNTSD